ncbi:hypothetical protein [Streptomyces sp. NPDC050504]|uniref:hypothetical protein n=1 Tax=Streptomyces sp. NPDC050504 TaxID=3365618 RepID=UPI00378D3443
MSFFATPRMMRHGSSVGADLPPDEAVVLDRPDPALRAALAAAAAGDHGPARALLAETRVNAEWERRNDYVAQFADAAPHIPGWLDAWLAESPDDPDAVLVKADLGIVQAWSVRTAALAKDVSKDQFQAFFALLEDTAPVISAAAELNPHDPTPWRVALTHALGSQAPREVFDLYWAEATSRAPHHYGCHRAALQYLCAKWYGSHREMFDFVERAADAALPGSRLGALPLLAAVEYEMNEPDGTGPEGTEGDDRIDPARIEAALDRALALSAGYAPGDPEAAGFRNHLALMLTVTKRWDDALEVFRAIGVHATTYPWRYLGPDPRTHFLEMRAGVRMNIAARTPFFSAPRRPAAPAWQGEAPSALAVVAAAPATVAQAALLSGATLRMAPARGGAYSYVELVADAPTGRRAALFTSDVLTRAAENFTTAEKWPALVLRRSGDRHGFTLVHKGDELVSHQWDPAAPLPDHAAALATAKVLADAFRVTDPRPVASLLRTARGSQPELLAALGLPPLPAGFGSRPEVLDAADGARVLARRGLIAGMKATVTSGDGEFPGAPAPARSRFWWVTRTLAVLFFVPLAGYAWTDPADTGWFRTGMATLAALVFSGELYGAVRGRRRR